MRKRKLRVPLALILLLSCLLGGCAMDTEEDDPLAAYNGTWYFAKNGVACEFGDGKIYRDDMDAEQGQTLTGIYDPAEDHIDAHITNTGGLRDPKPLYIVATDVGDVLCDHADGSGTVYFYREPLAALTALEEQEQLALAALPEPSADPTLSSPELSGAEPSNAPLPLSEANLETTSPSAQPSAEVQSDSSSVWVSKSGTKYHRDPSCSGMKNPSKITKSEAESRGLTPCKRCY